MRALFLVAVFLISSLEASELRALYNSLDPRSISEALAFYELYPHSEEGRSALNRAASLLQTHSQDIAAFFPPLVNRVKGSSESFTGEEIALIESLAAHLPNRNLKGYYARTEKEVLSLKNEEIDLGMALILSQLNNEEDAYVHARSYSAMLDLMALQILARLPEGATPEQKIQETNRFIFDQMHFRFPPHSVYAENIDLYTFLPSVMDNHLGVCLGVTALYLAVAQRIDLPLEIITPPGHIYVRYRDSNLQINIETTARGVHYPDETYLSIQNPELQQRTLKEVIGMTHVNQASVYLHTEEYPKAVAAYEKARPYMFDDPLVKELLGYSYLFTDKIEKGKELLREVENPSFKVAEDYLAGKVDLEGIQAAFMFVDETRDSIAKKQKRLENTLKKYPEFRDGLHQLAVTWIQLNRSKEAIEALTRYHAVDPSDPVSEYYLSVLHGQRQDYKNCWSYLKNAEEITRNKNFYPKALRELRRLLQLHCPE